MKRAVSCFGAIVGAALLVGNAQAESTELSYSYIEGGLSVLDLDGDPFDREGGFNFRGSVELNENFYLQGSWDRWEVLGEDLDSFKFGVGYRMPIADATDAFFEGSYIRAEVDSLDLDDDGARVDAGIRHSFGRNLEGRVFGGFAYTDEDESFVSGVDALMKIEENFGLNVGYENVEFDDHIFRINARFSF